MSRKRHILTYPLMQRIVLRLRTGTFDHIAAEAEGIPALKFQEWLRRADGPKPRKIYRDLKHEVMMAKAQARCTAESKMRLDDPRTWLLQGVGKETDRRPGWSRAPNAAPPEKTTKRWMCFRTRNCCAS
jgi:hypothetical protein